jgi:hypothetical protein
MTSPCFSFGRGARWGHLRILRLQLNWWPGWSWGWKARRFNIGRLSLEWKTPATASHFSQSTPPGTAAGCRLVNHDSLRDGAHGVEFASKEIHHGRR